MYIQREIRSKYTVGTVKFSAGFMKGEKLVQN